MIPVPRNATRPAISRSRYRRGPANKAFNWYFTEVSKLTTRWVWPKRSWPVGYVNDFQAAAAAFLTISATAAGCET